MEDQIAIFDPSDNSVTLDEPLPASTVALVPFDGTALLVTNAGIARLDVETDRWVRLGLFDPNRQLTDAFVLSSGSALLVGTLGADRFRGETGLPPRVRLWKLSPGDAELEELAILEAPPYAPLFRPIEGGGLIHTGRWSADPAAWQEAQQAAFLAPSPTPNAESFRAALEEIDSLRPSTSGVIWHINTLTGERTLIGELNAASLSELASFALPDGRRLLFPLTQPDRFLALDPGEVAPPATEVLRRTTGATVTALDDGRLLVVGGSVLPRLAFEASLKQIADVPPDADLDAVIDALAEPDEDAETGELAPNGAFILPALP